MKRPPAQCPSCERFIGPALVCPYCGADAERAPLHRLLRWGTLAMAVAGVAVLLMAGRHRDIPRIAVQSIDSRMNAARVRLHGRVERGPWIRREEGRVAYASFILDDGTGELRVAWSPPRGAADAGAQVPAAGEEVEVTGVLMVAADREPRLQLQRFERVERGGS